VSGSGWLVKVIVRAKPVCWYIAGIDNELVSINRKDHDRDPEGLAVLVEGGRTSTPGSI
jgi:hypothetical protein